MKCKTKVILFVSIVAIIVGGVLLLPLPKRISVMMPAINWKSGGYYGQTMVSWKGWYFEYLVKRDRIEGNFTLNAGTKKEIVLSIEKDILWDKHEDAEPMSRIWWNRGYDGEEFPDLHIYFNQSFDRIIVEDEKLGIFVAPASGEWELNEVIGYFQDCGYRFDWYK